jgi:hypothetical protein
VLATRFTHLLPAAADGGRRAIEIEAGRRRRDVLFEFPELPA